MLSVADFLIRFANICITRFENTGNFNAVYVFPHDKTRKVLYSRTGDGKKGRDLVLKHLNGVWNIIVRENDTAFVFNFSSLTIEQFKSFLAKGEFGQGLNSLPGRRVRTAKFYTLSYAENNYLQGCLSFLKTLYLAISCADQVLELEDTSQLESHIKLVTFTDILGLVQTNFKGTNTFSNPIATVQCHYSGSIAKRKWSFQAQPTVRKNTCTETLRLMALTVFVNCFDLELVHSLEVLLLFSIDPSQQIIGSKSHCSQNQAVLSSVSYSLYVVKNLIELLGNQLDLERINLLCLDVFLEAVAANHAGRPWPHRNGILPLLMLGMTQYQTELSFQDDGSWLSKAGTFYAEVKQLIKLHDVDYNDFIAQVAKKYNLEVAGNGVSILHQQTQPLLEHRHGPMQNGLGRSTLKNSKNRQVSSWFLAEKSARHYVHDRSISVSHHLAFAALLELNYALSQQLMRYAHEKSKRKAEIELQQVRDKEELRDLRFQIYEEQLKSRQKKSHQERYMHK